MSNGDCNLHENQRKAGTLCRSMNCSKCPPYRGPTLEQRLESAIQERDEARAEVEGLKAQLGIAVVALKYIGYSPTRDCKEPKAREALKQLEQKDGE